LSTFSDDVRLVAEDPDTGERRDSSVTFAMCAILVEASVKLELDVLSVTTKWAVPERDSRQPIHVTQTSLETLKADDLRVVEAWLRSPTSTLYPQVVQDMVRTAVRDATAHELDERFRVAGERVYDPHEDDAG